LDSRLIELLYLLPDFPIENCLVIDALEDEIAGQLKRRAVNLEIINYQELEKLEPNSRPLIGTFNCSDSPTIFFQKSYKLLSPQGACFAVVKRKNSFSISNGDGKPQFLKKMVTGHGYQDVRLYGICPSLDDPRFVVPLLNNRLTSASLGLYQPSLRKAKIRKGLSYLLGLISLSSLWTPYILIIGSKTAVSDSCGLPGRLAQSFLSEIECALFTGTPGALRKPTLQVMDHAGSILGYAKIAAEPKLEQLLKNEAEILKLLQKSGFRAAEVPRIKACERIHDHTRFLLVSTTKKPFSPGPMKLSEGHLEFLVELFNVFRTESIIGDSPFIHDLYRRFTQIKGQLSSPWKQLLKLAFNEISKINADTIPFGIAHRDFTPWNTYRAGNKLTVFDWEFARKNWPPLIDLLHFIIQQGVVVKKQTPERLLAGILAPHHHEGALILAYLQQIGIPRKLLPRLIIFYLVDIAILYLEKLAESAPASENDLALLTSWNSLLTQILNR